ncbi:hypothetical protein C498_06705 [Haloferax volcanii DS2]|uniref:Uncharacterized protein n=1 Tax=Haloferax volcanii (strain ATCC 29605 / DSM 3757 / JCM 8879 / NBRC 14742 / NCIMB 2012 / VKM B-1768 / DS2) TaxID=309800 RepID=L9V7T6_HALVD|nr:hypothetical protein C498_06705 [Haloferax volcanii DS2]
MFKAVIIPEDAFPLKGIVKDQMTELINQIDLMVVKDTYRTEELPFICILWGSILVHRYLLAR